MRELCRFFLVVFVFGFLIAGCGAGKKKGAAIDNSSEDSTISQKPSPDQDSTGNKTPKLKADYNYAVFLLKGSNYNEKKLKEEIQAIYKDSTYKVETNWFEKRLMVIFDNNWYVLFQRLHGEVLKKDIEAISQSIPVGKDTELIQKAEFVIHITIGKRPGRQYKKEIPTLLRKLAIFKKFILFEPTTGEFIEL